MRVDQSLAAEAATATVRTAARSTEDARRSSFATALEAVTVGARADRAEVTAAGKGSVAARASSAKEETRPVEGKPYAEIISGPRNGMFINRSGNGRDGEAFVRVERDGRDVHIYGSGKHRETVVMWHNEDHEPTAGADGVPAGEVSSRVEGKLYDEITAGPRNGMFINRSGNSRDGLAFVLVKHEHSEDHIYGSGKDRQVIRVWDEGYGPDAAPRKPGVTGGVSPTS